MMMISWCDDEEANEAETRQVKTTAFQALIFADFSLSQL